MSVSITPTPTSSANPWVFFPGFSAATGFVIERGRGRPTGTSPFFSGQGSQKGAVGGCWSMCKDRENAWLTVIKKIQVSAAKG